MKLSYSLKEIKRLIKPELRWVLSASNTSNGEKKTEKHHYHLCRIPSQQSLASWMYQAEEAWSLGSFQPLPLFGVRCMDCRLNFPTSFHCTNQEESTRIFFHKYSVCMPAIRNRRIRSHYADYRLMLELLLGHKILKMAGRIQNVSRSWKMWVGDQTCHRYKLLSQLCLFYEVRYLQTANSRSYETQQDKLVSILWFAI